LRQLLATSDQSIVTVGQLRYQIAVRRIQYRPRERPPAPRGRFVRAALLMSRDACVAVSGLSGVRLSKSPPGRAGIVPRRAHRPIGRPLGCHISETSGRRRGSPASPASSERWDSLYLSVLGPRNRVLAAFRDRRVPSHCSIMPVLAGVGATVIAMTDRRYFGNQNLFGVCFPYAPNLSDLRIG